MMKFNLLLLDANVVIYLFELGIWDDVVDACDVHLARTVVNEASFYEDGNGVRNLINLTPYENQHAIAVHDALPNQLKALTDKFGLYFLERLDPGEAESLALLCGTTDTFLICSSDHIVFRVLGALRRSEQGVSLEEILAKIGRSHRVDSQFTKRFRDSWTKRGFTEGTWGLGVK